MTRRLSAALGLVLTTSVYAQAPTDPALAARVDSALSALEARGFSGVVRVDRNGAPLIEKGYGLANRATQTRFSPQTVVQIGSNTKDFTAVAILQLIERGKLAMRDSLGRFFVNAPADKRGITILQLLNHTAGFPIGLGGDFEPLNRQQLIDAAMQRPLLFPPGTRDQYSNTGFSLLAAIIEQSSGQTYDEYVRDNILRPLGLTHTGLLLPRFDPATLAHGYRAGTDVGTMLTNPHAADGSYWNLRGNGGMLSTVGDMHAFYRALFESDKLMKPATRALRFHADEPVGLAGSDMVSSFLYERLPGRGLEIIVASNSSEFRLEPVRSAIASALGLPQMDGGGRATSGPRAAAKAPSPEIAALVRDFIAAVNAGDAKRLTTFIGEHFLIEPGSPPADARAQRWAQAHGNLGAITVNGLDQVDPNTVEVSVVTANEGASTLKFLFGAGGRIAGVQVLVGG